MDNKEKELRDEYQQLKQQLEDPDIYSSKEYPKLAKRFSALEDLMDLFDQKQVLTGQMAEARQMATATDQDLVALANLEIDNLERQLAENDTKLTEALLPKDLNDERDCIIEIRAAAGGDEASLFAGELYRMYSRWCETHGYKTELISESPS
ncbi:MAG TPA: PCRF domain-containing protein, partial [Candidatus Babeliales bacterium]|nr:PCRF domain-containing protein [Candidatus Babeliales bacterium]